MLKPVVVILALATLPFGATAAVAQDVFVPSVTTASPGYLFPNDQYQRNRQGSGSAKSRKSAPAAQVQLDAAAQARVRAAVQALVPEYNARAKRNGENSANQWIRQKAFELGQQEAELMKRRQGRN
ncbi:hypothetical protein FPY71_01510 [Aureimonas fodinaquatilis]|uniref:DUF4148 domain-containing protein n=1 Tax=Aureimonas fodinaquatilis TaxID=2565783 RepID=A0A5B0E131_9HYPH|nr:hypothetical protein [Aureimonas fodinaquatilis]KAA0971835.1 hypothetical protein FPY71_01510 [Aureimonas fodinaquatilis]